MNKKIALAVGVAAAALILGAVVYYYKKMPPESNAPTTGFNGPTLPPPGPRPLPPPPNGGTCKNQCGNGQCEEIVCLAIGCPCAETVQTCPQDCKTPTQ